MTVLATSREPLALQAEERCARRPALPDPATPPRRTLFAVGAPARTTPSSTSRRERRRRRRDLPPRRRSAAGDRARRRPLRAAVAGRDRAAPRRRARRRAPAARDAPARHQTLRATIDWSHELLTGDEQACFASFAVFAGGATVDAAEAVTGARARHPRPVGGQEPARAQQTADRRDAALDARDHPRVRRGALRRERPCRRCPGAPLPPLPRARRAPRQRASAVGLEPHGALRSRWTPTSRTCTRRWNGRSALRRRGRAGHVRRARLLLADARPLHGARSAGSSAPRRCRAQRSTRSCVLVALWHERCVPCGRWAGATCSSPCWSGLRRLARSLGRSLAARPVRSWSGPNTTWAQDALCARERVGRQAVVLGGALRRRLDRRAGGGEQGRGRRHSRGAPAVTSPAPQSCWSARGTPTSSQIFSPRRPMRRSATATTSMRATSSARAIPLTRASRQPLLVDAPVGQRRAGRSVHGSPRRGTGRVPRGARGLPARSSCCRSRPRASPGWPRS